LAGRNQVTTAFDTFQDFKTTVVVNRELIDTLKLIADAQLLAQQLHRDAGAAREADSQPPKRSKRERSRPAID
jgi:hypothetical protein